MLRRWLGLDYEMSDSAKAAVRGVVDQGLSRLVFWLIVWFFAVWTIAGIRDLIPSTYDDTDKGWIRSNMELRTDYGTCLQYLTTGGGGLTPRLDANGNHMRAADCG